MKRQSRREMVEGVQYAAFWLANEIHSVPREAAFATLLREVSDKAVDFVISCSGTGRQIVAVLTGALATKLYGDPDKDYAIEWTDGEELDSEMVLASALQLERLQRGDLRQEPRDRGLDQRLGVSGGGRSRCSLRLDGGWIGVGCGL